MSKHAKVQIPCPVCTQPTRDGLMCMADVRKLEADLRELPVLMGELTVQFARLSQAGTGNGGRGATTPVPFDERSSEHRDLIVNTITTWIRDLEAGDPPMRNSMAVWCQWLLDRMPRIRMHPEPKQLVDEIHHCVVLARNAIDTPGVRLPCGDCPTCGKTVTASVGATEGVCRACSWAGIESVIPVDMSRSALLDKAKDALVTRAELLAYAKVYQVSVNTHTFRSWVQRGRLKPTEVTADGIPMYRVGDVLALAQQAG